MYIVHSALYAILNNMIHFLICTICNILLLTLDTIITTYMYYYYISRYNFLWRWKHAKRTPYVNMHIYIHSIFYNSESRRPTKNNKR